MFKRDNVLVSYSQKGWNGRGIREYLFSKRNECVSKGRTLDRARHRQLEAGNDRRMISRIGKERNSEPTRTTLGKKKTETQDEGPRGRLNVKCADALCVKLYYQSSPPWLERLSSRLSSLAPSTEGPSGVLQEVSRLPLGPGGKIHVKRPPHGAQFRHVELRHPRNRIPRAH